MAFPHSPRYRPAARPPGADPGPGPAMITTGHRLVAPGHRVLRRTRVLRDVKLG
ncbi:hypothetical protein Ae168Ps1_1552 [Pseudonocardia sp. Ae168_Ps1]|nr:hypothetical protein Ae150APs1_1547 [Pseudonocardia sp. Ae150A_Ps1]OLL79146.1 hypothetical protein Ae168Ps1_1552 [Pseudonocardia sp. Ae168_Ps1]OLL93238.1 hypothetical protein Ae356Ps1_3135 [Pseudonocardia sp. Ae356_Ps1]